MTTDQMLIRLLEIQNSKLDTLIALQKQANEKLDDIYDIDTGA